MRKEHEEYARGFIIASVVLAAVVWYFALFDGLWKSPELYFLDIGQGDATLIVLEGGVTVLVDAGPDRTIVDALERTHENISYIDLVMISHPQRDHFGGMQALLEQVRIGTFLITGRSADGESADEWESLIEDIRKKGIPIVTVGQGSTVRYSGNEIAVLGPDSALIQSGDLNDTSLVMRLRTSAFSALFTGDIGKSAEQYLAPFLSAVDILKVPHHGSKNSSGEEFLRRVSPRIAVIQVGENRYGHPTQEAISRLEGVGAAIFRNDRDGTVRVEERDGKLLVFTEKDQ